MPERTSPSGIFGVMTSARGKEQFFHQVRHAARSERGAACSDEDRVHNDVFGLVEAKPFGDDFDQCRGGYHTDFDGVREDVRKDGVKLCGQKLRCYIENTETPVVFWAVSAVIADMA